MIVFTVTGSMVSCVKSILNLGSFGPIEWLGRVVGIAELQLELQVY